MKLKQQAPTMKTKQPIYIYGPPGCGKSLNAEALASTYNCDTIVDDWSPGDKVPDGALVLTNCYVPEGISFYEAMNKLQGSNNETISYT